MCFLLYISSKSYPEISTLLYSIVRVVEKEEEVVLPNGIRYSPFYANRTLSTITVKS